jgi:hypothetical protein
MCISVEPTNVIAVLTYTSFMLHKQPGDCFLRDGFAFNGGILGLDAERLGCGLDHRA